MTSAILYLLAGGLLLASAVKNTEKTKKSLKMAWRSFQKLLPNVLAMMLFVGLTLAVLDETVINRLIGPDSGIFGVLSALIIGSVTLIPSFVAFPLGGALLKAGAGYAQIAALVSTIMAVGIVTLPMEIKYFGKAVALRRNGIAFVVSVLFTAVIWRVM